MKSSTFDICFEIATLIEKKNSVIHCTDCKGLMNYWHWKCNNCGKETCTYCLVRKHLHGKQLKQIDETIYIKKYKERDEARRIAKEFKQKEIIEKREVKKDENRMEEYQKRKMNILKKYGIKKTNESPKTPDTKSEYPEE